MGTLIHAEELRMAKLDHYYHFLNDDPDYAVGQNRQRFPDALAGLFQRFGEAAGAVRRQAAEGFTRKWPLPSDHGVDDLFASFDRWRAGEHKWEKHPLLHPGPRSWIYSSVGSVTSVSEGGRQGGDSRLAEPMPWIFPPLPLPFLYDPTKPGTSTELDERIDRLAADIRSSVTEQAASLEMQAREQGWESPHGRHRGTGAGKEFGKAALRLYRRAVCGMTYSLIANLEGAGRDAATVGKSVRSLATTLRIPLA